MMTFDEYQVWAGSRSKYEDIGLPCEVFTALGLNEESGEVAGKIKKYYRDHLDREMVKNHVCLELGDVLWYLSETARHWGLKLSDVVNSNFDKINSRHARGVIHGSGDNR